MCLDLLRRALPGTALAALLAAPAAGQVPSAPCPAPSAPCPTPSAPCPAPLLIPAPAAPEQRPTQPEQAQPRPETPAPAPPAAPPTVTEPTLTEQSAATAEGMAAFAPNIIGDLLYGYRSISFHYQRSAGPINVLTNGATSIINPSVAENNSPLPRDRVSYRFNYFQSAQSVTGIGAATIPVAGVASALPFTRNYDLSTHTFSFEKTFLDRLMSVEMRVPFSTGLSPRMNLSAGDIAGRTPGTDQNGNPLFLVNPTPNNTLGSTDTFWGNITLILKGLAYRSDRFAFSGGAAMTFPTAPDTNVTVIDYSSTAQSLAASGQRVRGFHVNNSTVALSPFVAALATPNDRLFVQSFLQVDVPLNSSNVTFVDYFTRGAFGVDPALVASGQALAPPFAVNRNIVDQPLMHVNVGTGYWLVRNPNASWLNGIAPVLELHYTTTLRNANVVTLPGDGSQQANPADPTQAVPEVRPQVGNLRNRLDILNLTAGTTFLLGNRATLATGVAVPLRGGDDRLFNWEYQMQLNFYFGAAGTRAPFAPTF